MSLRARILLMVSAMASAALAGGVVTMAYMIWLGSVLTSVSEHDVTAMRVARELQSSLIMQKGFATYFSQDKDPNWLVQLDQWRNSFEQWLGKAMQSPGEGEAKALLERIEAGPLL